MYRFIVLLASVLLIACSDPPAPAITVDCARALAEGITVDCGDGDTNSNVTGDGNATGGGGEPDVILKAGCFQDLTVCPQAYEGSWLLEHCTISYACPAANTPNPDELICMRKIDDECWDMYSN